MKNKHEKLDTLLSKYPEVFVDKSDKDGHDFEGFRCNDGWFPIVEALCKNLSGHNKGREAEESSKWYRSMHKMINHKIEGVESGPMIAGGREITMENAHEFFPINLPAKIKISCVKEKFGSLSISCDGNYNCDDRTCGMIGFASSMSHYFCEDCGTPHEVGKTRFFS